MGYALPSDTSYVSCSWSCHRNRNPPSTEPGTDYGCGHGSPLYAAGDGVVVEIKTTTSGATGRYLTIDMDDGRRCRSLHLSAIWVNVGQRVGRGNQIGVTGASGYGSEWGYGAHVHQTLWAGHYYDFCPDCTLDFAAYVGDAPTPPPEPEPEPEEEEEMNVCIYWRRGVDGETVYALHNTTSGWWSEWIGSDAAYNTSIAIGYRTGNFVAVTESHAMALKSSIDLIRQGRTPEEITVVLESSELEATRSLAPATDG